MASTQQAYLELAAGVDEVREVARALVAGFKADGFTDREAHAITAGIFASKIEQEEED